MPDETTEDEIGFSPPRDLSPDPLDPTTTHLSQPDHQFPTDPTRPRVSGSPEDIPPPPKSSGPGRSTSSTTFSEVEEALAGYGASGFFLASMGINKLVVQRSKRNTTRWMATDEEAGKFGEALGRIMARRVPEELVDNGDTADYLIMGEAVLSYGIRAGLGLSPEDAMAMAEQYVAEQGAQQAGPPPTPQPVYEPPSAPAPRAAVAHIDDGQGGAYGAVPATPPPPAVIQPDI